MFTHLHVHSHYSLLDGATSPAELCCYAKELGYKSLALTDTNGLYGALVFMAAAKDAGIRPIFGAVITQSLPPMDGESSAVVLAKDAKGFSELCQIVTARQLEKNFNLAGHLSCATQHVAILTPNLQLAKQIAKGRKNLGVFVELFDHSVRGDPGRLSLAAQQAAEARLPMVATHAVHFGRPEEHGVHRALRAVHLGSTWEGIPSASYFPASAHLASMEEMKRRFAHLPGVLERTERLAELCVGLPMTGQFTFPAYACPSGENEFSYLTKICFEGLRQRYRPMTPEALLRLAHELAIIAGKKFAGYFLVVWDIAEEARRRGIPTVGRGSAANSIVSYCLRITHVDPIAHGLFFERFLNPEREDPPDIDLDFPWDQRDEMLRYAYARFSPERVAMVSTHMRLHGRSAVREAAKVLGLSEAEISAFCSRLPHYGSVADIPKAQAQISEARDLPLREEPWKSVLTLAAKLDQIPRHLSVHPGGIVISPKPISECMPKEMSAKGVEVTQYDMYSVEDSGFVKIDLLGQRGLAVIRDVTRQINLDWSKIDPYHDAATQTMLREGRTMGCFYVESPAMRLLLRKLNCDDFELLTAASSIIRPGVSNSGMMRMFVKRHLGQQEVSYAHPILKTLLQDTYGVMVYQEDVIKVVHAIAGMSLGEADKLRRCMSKKRHGERMAAYRQAFFDGARRQQVSEKAAEEIWRQIESFGGYAFCKAHSASYAQLSFQSAYLKAHYPAAFMAAVLSNQGGFYSPAAYWEEARRLGLKMLGPDVNMGEWKYTASREGLRAGLLQVKGLARDHAEALVKARREQGCFKSMRELWARTPLTRQEVEVLIATGACDGLGKNRTRLMWDLTLAPVRADNYSAELALAAEEITFVGAGPSPEDDFSREWARLGLSPEAHPLMQFRERLSRLAGKAADGPALVAAADLGAHAGQRVRVYGWLVTWRGNRVQRTGEMMKFITLEDFTATFEVTLFPEAYQAHGHKLHGMGPYLVEGRVEDDQGGVTIVAETVERLS